MNERQSDSRRVCRCGCGAPVANEYLPGHQFRRDVQERFWEKVNKTAECWLWTGATDGGGYGNFWFGARTAKAHRVSYEWARGEIADGLELDHLCRTPACVNPAHLEAVTHAENLYRGNAPAARQRRQTHCKRGHELAGDNLLLDRGGHRSCRICHREMWNIAAKRRRARRKAQT